MTTAIEAIGQWTATTGAPPAEARRKAVRAFVDTVAVILAGAAEPSSLRSAAAFAALGGSATALFDRRISSPWAALVNGAASHALDFDDGENVGFTHVSAVLVPAILALGEERGLSGKALIDSYVVGFEVVLRLGEWLGTEHYGRGWHSTSTIAGLGATAACARLLGLNAEASGHAVSLASSMAGGFRSQFGTMAKHLHAGLGAKTGVVSALLAEAGVTGSVDVLDGKFSLADLMTNRPTRPFTETVKLGEPLSLMTFGPSAKRFAACGSTHGALDAILELKAAHDFELTNVVSVETQLPDISYSALIQSPPRDEMEARFSLQHCAAVAIDKGELPLDGFSPEALSRPDYRAFHDRVQILPYDGTNAYKNGGVYWTRTVITLDDGRELATEITDKRGSPLNPLSDQDLKDKFRMCATYAFEVDDPDELCAKLFNLEDVDNISRLMTEITAKITRKGH